MKYIILSGLFTLLSVCAFADEPIPDYALQWEDAQINIADLAKQCENSSKPQVTATHDGGSEERTLQVRCNIKLPIDKIQAIDEYPYTITANGTVLGLEYAANKGVFTHTLHVKLLKMDGFKSAGNGVIINVPKQLNPNQKYQIEQSAINLISAEIHKTLSQTKEVINGKRILNPLPVNNMGQAKILLPVSYDIFLEVIRAHPESFNLKYPKNLE